MFITQALAAAAEVAAEGAEAAANGAEHGGGFPPFDSSTYSSQLFWLAITFGIFYWLIKNTLVPRIGSILETRQDRIAQDLDKARELKEEADAAEAAYEQELAAAKANANDIAQKARDKAKAEADAERNKVEAALNEKLEKSEARIAEVRASAMKEVSTIAEDTTAVIMQELLGIKATKAEVTKAVSASGSKE